jgi:hypothetical protein
MLQNRVDPQGRIFATSARGLWMGNRGVIHNDQKQIVRDFRNKAWIVCKLEFKSRKRAVMSPDRWTELFFLDEATAFSAGHRPCFECRREAALRFKSCWVQGNPSYHFTTLTTIKQIDDIIHGERIRTGHNKVTHRRNISTVPDGVFVLIGDNPFLFYRAKLYRWTPFGYEAGERAPTDMEMEILTPCSIVNAFDAGYVPQISL